MSIRILGTTGAGSTLAEAFLTLAGLHYSFEEVDYEKPGPSRDKLLSFNSLGQVPTLVLANGTVLTESLAIAIYAQAQNPKAQLIPSPYNVKFWRWAVFLIAAVYPTFTYGDEPGKWVANAEGASQLRLSTDAWRRKLWADLEVVAEAPYFLGEEFSVIDIYLAVMTQWRPGRSWFKEHCPRILKISEKVGKLPQLKALMQRNFS